MEFRRAKEQDIEGLMNLLAQVLEIHNKIRPDVFNAGATKFTKDQLKEMIKCENDPIYVLVDNEEVVGHAFCKTRYPALTHLMKPCKTLYIDDFVVDEKHRNKGIGERLFNYVKEEAIKLKCDNITLNVWSDNVKALRFYEKMGLNVRSLIMEYKL